MERRSDRRSPPAPAATRRVSAVRLHAQLLSGRPARSVEAVAERLLAVQGQDPRGVRLAVRARSRGLSVADFDRALTERRSVVINWLNRGTLHLVRGEDHHWLHALTAPTQMTGSTRRLAQEGISPAERRRALSAIERSLAEEGPLTRGHLRDRLAAARVRTEGQALIHLLFAASLEGLLVRGPMVGREHAYALVRDWLGEPPRVDREQALGELALRYLAGHAPGDERDLARWSGLPLRDARAAIAGLGSRVRVRRDGLLELSRRSPAASEMPPPRLLGTFDPVLLGWCSREAVLGAHGKRVLLGGMFKAFALADGRAVAGWSVSGKRVELQPFEPIGREVRSELEADGAEVRRYLGLTRS